MYLAGPGDHWCKGPEMVHSSKENVPPNGTSKSHPVWYRRMILFMGYFFHLHFIVYQLIQWLAETIYLLHLQFNNLMEKNKNWMKILIECTRATLNCVWFLWLIACFLLLVNLLLIFAWFCFDVFLMPDHEDAEHRPDVWHGGAAARAAAGGRPRLAAQARTHSHPSENGLSCTWGRIIRFVRGKHGPTVPVTKSHVTPVYAFSTGRTSPRTSCTLSSLPSGQWAVG